jgi:hypothetical protein
MDDRLSALADHWLPGFNFNVEEWDEKGLRKPRNPSRRRVGNCLVVRSGVQIDRLQKLANHARRALPLARTGPRRFRSIAEKPAGRFMILNRTRTVKHHPDSDR